jgi:TfoX/Sxy family transcriptional regulator of competence genes
MATSKEYSEYILHILGEGFSTKSMFGEFCLYYMGKTVAFICDDRLLIKPTKQSAHLDEICEMQEAYPGSKLYYLVTDDQLSEPRGFIDTMRAIAAATPDKKAKKKK